MFYVYVYEKVPRKLRGDLMNPFKEGSLTLSLFSYWETIDLTLLIIKRMSRYGQVENENNAQFDRLSSTLAQFRAVNQDIHNIARESTLIDSLSEQMSSLYDGIRNSSQGLTRSMQSGHGVWRYVGLALLAFVVLYTLWKFV